MNVDEAINLANQGNAESMLDLGSYYYDQGEYHNARDWYCKAAENGLLQAMVPAALLTGMVVRATRKISGGDAIHDEDVNKLGIALAWIERARAAGIECDASALIRERGLCAYEAAKKEGSNVSQESSIRFLKEAYATPNTAPEVEIFLACALYEAEQLTAEDTVLCFDLLKSCVNFTEEDGVDVNLGVLEFYLGSCYLKGKGTPVDVNAAHDCFVRAGQKGFDCSDILRNFKKKLFGGYVLQR